MNDLDPWQGRVPWRIHRALECLWAARRRKGVDVGAEARRWSDPQLSRDLRYIAEIEARWR